MIRYFVVHNFVCNFDSYTGSMIHNYYLYEEDGQLYGRARCQAPDVDGVTYVPEGAVGDVALVTIADTLLYEMEGA